MTYDPWLIATILYIAAAIISFAPVLMAALGKIRVAMQKPAFNECPHFDDAQKDRLNRHYNRIVGTLIYWKTTAAAYRRFHTYVLIWTIPSSVLIPVLTQSIAKDNYSSLMVTVVSAFTALLLTFHQAFKVDDKFVAVRNSESGFYDLYRRILDLPGSFAKKPDEQIDEYFKAVEAVRSSARGTETDLTSPQDMQGLGFQRMVGTLPMYGKLRGSDF